MELAVACLLLAALTPCAVLAQNRPFPVLPATFIAEVEANILNRGYTVQVTEYYDSTNDRVRFESLRNGSRSVIIDDIQNGIRYRTDLDKQTCQAGNITNTSRLVNATTGVSHLLTVSDFFRFGRAYHDRYVGTKMVRGISCDQYTSNYTSTTPSGFYSSYVMQWYFAIQDNWTMPTGSTPGTAIPVRLELIGVSNFSRPNATARGPPPTGPPPTVPLHHFDHVYEFTNFRAGAVATQALTDPDLFNPPAGIYCTGLPIVKDLPVLPLQFSLSSTASSSSATSTYTSYYAYDFVRGETATFYDFEVFGNFTANGTGYGGRHHFIHNFREGTQYNITDDGCSLETLVSVANTPGSQDISLINGHAGLKSTNSLWQFTSDHNFTYQGHRTVLGVKAEVWVVIRTDGAFGGPANQTTLWEYYFSQPTWKFNTFNGLLTNTRVPLQVRGHVTSPGQDMRKTLITVADYTVGPPRSHLFDDSTCFTADQQTTNMFTLNTQFSNSRNLNQALNKQLAMTMNVTTDRFHLTTFPGAGNSLNILARVHDVPTIGDPSLLSQLTTMAAANAKLQQSVTSGTFSVMIPGTGSVAALANSYTSSASNQPATSASASSGAPPAATTLRQSSSNSPAGTTPSTSTGTTPSQAATTGKLGASQGTKYSPGEMAGLGIGAILMGVAVGGVVVYLVQKRRNSDVAYMVQ